MTTALRALRHRNYRIFYAGQFVSILGTWMQTVATSWLVYRLTGSALLLGVTSAVQQLPILFLSPIAGVWVDRLDRRKVLIVTCALAAVQAATLATLTFSGAVHVSHVIAIALCIGAINAFETPTRQAFLIDMVGGRDDLPNAIALNSMMFNSARFIGPSIAGLALAAFGEAWCFLINAVTFIVILSSYAWIRVTRHSAPKPTTHWLSDLAGGVRYAFGYVGTRRLLLLLAALSVCTAPWQSLMPIFADRILGGDSRTLGFLIGAVGFGALGGTVLLVFRPGVRGLGRVISMASLVAAIALALFSLSNVLWLSLALLAVFGFGLIATVASCNTVLQTIADEDKRGRVISLYVMCFLGFAPIGNFAAGALAEAIGARWALFTCGALMIAASLTFLRTLPTWRVAVREAYIRHGIIPDPASSDPRTHQ